jgi:hypothetical protein
LISQELEKVGMKKAAFLAAQQETITPHFAVFVNRKYRKSYLVVSIAMAISYDDIPTSSQKTSGSTANK